jgi:hypothetical protein
VMCRASAASTSGELFVETIAYESVCRLALSVLRFHSLLESCDDCLYVCRRGADGIVGAPQQPLTHSRGSRARRPRERHTKRARGRGRLERSCREAWRPSVHYCEPSTARSTQRHAEIVDMTMQSICFR